MAEVKTIAVVQGGTTPVVQALFRDFIAGLAGVRVAGVVEQAESLEGDVRRNGALCSLTDTARFPIFQDLGCDATACRLDASGVVSACAAVERDLAAGCDLVVLSKFGKLESDRGGLGPAFAAAITAQVPVLTSVSSHYAAAWERFAAPLYVVLPPDAAAIAGWWAQVRATS